MFGQMKTKSLFIRIFCILVTSIIVVLLSNQTPDFQHLVKETNKHIGKLKNLNYAGPNVQELQPELDEKYMRRLGFLPVPRLYPIDLPGNVTPPVVVTAVTSGSWKAAHGFALSVRRHLANSTLVIYGVGLSPDDNYDLKTFCNCTYRKFQFEDYPSHVSILKLHAYRPIIIQETLNEFGMVIYLDPSVRVTTPDIAPYLRRARASSVLAWKLPSALPTSALTHEKMFTYFNTKRDSYYFHHMVEPRNLVAYNTEAVHQHVMLPWLQCALTPQCIAPIGAQDTGCNFEHKPMYRYSGCHSYDASALNVVLGRLFKFNYGDYVGNETFFRPARPGGDAVAGKQETSTVGGRPLVGGIVGRGGGGVTVN
ncbi:PREDICTED: uncharacterized protein LOC106813482 [Priapulus caudatus]|uniref:Uncharacterized protein LOC106813482 n=1 Tax=Priapulus caudatus TaxID=37621 RepID=A0ABM1ELN7_PRICU|nr:PREDICTED: uncharacterized protein LOC106813482 [Priapulus caudatus]